MVIKLANNECPYNERHRILTCAREAIDATTYFIFIDIFYIIGGSTDPHDQSAISYDVTTVHIKTGKVGQVEDTLRATNAAKAASSLTRIALCGGKTGGKLFEHCQMYSPLRDV